MLAKIRGAFYGKNEMKMNNKYYVSLNSDKLYKATKFFLKRLSREKGKKISLSEVVKNFLRIAVREEYYELYQENIDEDIAFQKKEIK